MLRRVNLNSAKMSNILSKRLHISLKIQIAYIASFLCLFANVPKWDITAPKYVDLNLSCLHPTHSKEVYWKWGNSGWRVYLLLHCWLVLCAVQSCTSFDKRERLNQCPQILILTNTYCLPDVLLCKSL